MPKRSAGMDVDRMTGMPAAPVLAMATGDEQSRVREAADGVKAALRGRCPFPHGRLSDEDSWVGRPFGTTRLLEKDAAMPNERHRA